MRFQVSSLAILSSLTYLAAAHTILIEPRKRGMSRFPVLIPQFFADVNVLECFFEELHRDDKMTVTFLSAPVGEGNNEIGFWVNCLER